MFPESIDPVFFEIGFPECSGLLLCGAVGGRGSQVLLVAVGGVVVFARPEGRVPGVHLAAHAARARLGLLVALCVEDGFTAFTPERERERETDRQRDRQTERGRGGEREAGKDRQTERQTERGRGGERERERRK